MNPLKNINREIREIMTMLHEGHYWDEIGEYLVSEGFEKKELTYTVIRYNDTFEVWYIRDGIKIEIVNDLEVRIHYDIKGAYSKVMVLERDNKEVFVKFE